MGGGGECAAWDTDLGRPNSVKCITVDLIVLEEIADE